MSDDQPATEPGSEPGPESPEPVWGRPRKAPRYGSFVVTGAVVGIVIGVVLSVSRPASGQFSQNSVIGYVAAIFGLLGALAGGAAAVLFDRTRPRGDREPPESQVPLTK